MTSLARVFLAAGLLAVVPVAMAQDAGFGGDSDPQMSVLGVGQYETAPEVAEFVGEVVTSAETLAGATGPHPDAVSAVREVIDGLAVDGLILETARYSVREDRPMSFNQGRPEQVAETNFNATTRFRFSSRNLTDLAQIITKLALTDLRVSGLTFKVEDNRLPLLEARKDAARDAVAQANAYAAALNVDLLQIQNVTDGDAVPVELQYGEADMGILQPDSNGPPLSIEIPDLLQFRANVTVTWEIQASAQ